MSRLRTWTEEQNEYIKKNIHLSNEQLAVDLGKTQAAVENKVRELGLARTFRTEEIEILKKVWGQKRSSICTALPRFTWQQISKKANRIGLPALKDVRESAHLYSIISAMGESESKIKKWIKAGLKVTNDKTKNMKNNILLVDIDEFWKFAMKHPDIVDLTRLKDNVLDVLGVPPLEMRKMQQAAVPFKRHKKRCSGNRRRELAQAYHMLEKPVEQIADMFGVSVDTVRRASVENRKPWQKYRCRATVVTTSFIRQLEKLYYQEGKSQKECATELGCSLSSVWRGVNKLVEQRQSINV